MTGIINWCLRSSCLGDRNYRDCLALQPDVTFSIEMIDKWNRRQRSIVKQEGFWGVTTQTTRGTWDQLFCNFCVCFCVPYNFGTWGPKIIILNIDKNNNLVWLKSGSGRRSSPLKRSAPCTPGFCELKKNLPPGRYTHRYGGGSWASSQGRLWPFLGKFGRCTYR